MKNNEIGRLAFRVEGNYWNSYYALSETMDGALLLGSISMAAITTNPNRKKLFMAMMRGIVGDIIEESSGVRPDWTDPRTAPEHEKAGRA